MSEDGSTESFRVHCFLLFVLLFVTGLWDEGGLLGTLGGGNYWIGS